MIYREYPSSIVNYSADNFYDNNDLSVISESKFERASF